MSDGEITFSTKLDNKDLEKDLNALSKKIRKLETDVEVKRSSRSPLLKMSKELGVSLDAAKKKLDKMQSASKNVFTKEQISTQAETVKALQAEWDRVTAKVEKYNREIAASEEKIKQSKKQAGLISQQMSVVGENSEKMAKATEKSKKSAKQFHYGILQAARSVVVFGLAARAFSAFSDWIVRVIKSNDAATQSIARLKGALLTLAQPIVDFVVPAFTALVNAIATVAFVISRLVSAFTGKTAEESANAAEQLDKESGAIGGVGDAAKEATKDLASFDEINRLTAGTAAGVGAAGGGIIKPDFSGIKLDDIPDKLKNIVLDIEAKIRDLKFKWDSKTILKSKSAWKVALSAILGAAIGGMFGGIKGAVIGLILGLSAGIISCTFNEGENDNFTTKESLLTVLGAMIGGAMGGAFGGIKGGIIGILLGGLITLTMLDFAEGKTGYEFDTKDTLITVMGAMLGAALGGIFFGIKGATIGLLLGALISFVAIEFSEGKYNKNETIATLRIVLLAVFGAVFGAMFGHFAGGVVGMLIGLTIGFASVAFDSEIDSETKAKASRALFVALTTIIGAIIGAALGFGVFGGIIGGAIGLSFGLIVSFTDAKIEDKSKLKRMAGVTGTERVGRSAAQRSYSVSSASIPALARGAVIPPNRRFLAELGDQRSGTNIEAPLETIVQAMRIALGDSDNKEAVMVVDGEVFGRLAYKLGGRESRRVGVRFGGVK